MTAGYTSWWATNVAKVGAYVPPTSASNATDDTNLDADLSFGSDKFIICSSIIQQYQCNYRSYNKNNTPATNTLIEYKENWITYKTVGKANTTVWT